MFLRNYIRICHSKLISLEFYKSMTWNWTNKWCYGSLHRFEENYNKKELPDTVNTVISVLNLRKKNLIVILAIYEVVWLSWSFFNFCNGWILKFNCNEALELLIWLIKKLYRLTLLFACHNQFDSNLLVWMTQLSRFKLCTMLQKLSKYGVKAWLC